MAKPKKIETLFNLLLKDFAEDPDPEIVLVPYKKGTEIKVVEEYSMDLPQEVQIHSPFIVFIIFVFLKKFRFYGQEEKVAWSIPVKYKGVSFLLTHRKFGFRIISNTDSAAIRELAKEAIGKINSAIPLAETMFQPFVRGQVKLGNITLDNKYLSIRSRYLFFRKKATQEFRKAEKAPAGTSISNDIIAVFHDGIERHNRSLKYSSAGNNYATAMLDSYFCLIEHVFVLLLPFLHHVNIDDLDIEAFIGYNWKQKLKLVVPLTGNTKHLKIFERLDKIKEELRNPLTHGYFLKDGHSFYVHTPHLGAIPMTLNNKNRHIHYGFYAIESFNFKTICACFDDFDSLLDKGNNTKFGMMFIKSNATIAFDKASSENYKKAMTTKNQFEEFISYQIRQQDNAANMDW